ncbi:DNA-binding protein [Aquabacterium sp. A7-Y]|uniref:FitA-like ribbon-helix-helix domain-containing protein n=1 Tax=Aquabacterium sp. A7-Y TaxID=1349605 RepID=UPI00223D9DF4|nr:DNA-binding protein [Aquabacterium sp. A7-Y]MCW7538228.1 DNA-binding protein [Aquabacterium sp. A7-Y]
MADLLVCGLDDALVESLRKRAAASGRSVEAEHRSILSAALAHPARRSFIELLLAMPDVGRDEDFERGAHGA